MTLEATQNVSFGAGAGSIMINWLTDNAAFVNIACAIGFGFVYALCSIWNAYSNHKRNVINKRVICDEILDEIIKKNEFDHESVAAIRKIKDRA